MAKEQVEVDGADGGGWGIGSDIQGDQVLRVGNSS